MNRINHILNRDKKILSLYFTAGYPELNDTSGIIKAIEQAGVDLVEIGLPFSDPLADGPTIQKSSKAALDNGMSTARLFDQLQSIREHVEIPLIIMGYFNPILQFGVEKFCQKCSETGIDGLIIPDLPVNIYNRDYRRVFESYQLKNIFLITPQTSKERIELIDRSSDAFIYMVSSASITGSKNKFGHEQMDYFKRIEAMELNNPTLVGFGISDEESFKQATAHAKGAIIGSAFIRHLTEHGLSNVSDFVNSINPQ